MAAKKPNVNRGVPPMAPMMPPPGAPMPANRGGKNAPPKKSDTKKRKKSADNRSRRGSQPYYDPQTGWNSRNDQILYEMACDKVKYYKKAVKSEKDPVMRGRYADVLRNYELLVEKLTFRDYVSVNNIWNSGMLANPNIEDAARERALALAAAKNAGLPPPVTTQAVKKQSILQAAGSEEDDSKELRAYIRKKEKMRIRMRLLPFLSLLLFAVYIVALYLPYYITGPYATNAISIVLSLFYVPLLASASSVAGTIVDLLAKLGLDGINPAFYSSIMEGGAFQSLQFSSILDLIAGYGTILALALCTLIAVISLLFNLIRLFTGATKKVQLLSLLLFLFSAVAAFGIVLTNTVNGDIGAAFKGTITGDAYVTNGMGYMMIVTVGVSLLTFILPLLFPTKSKYVDEIEKNKADLDLRKLPAQAIDSAEEERQNNRFEEEQRREQAKQQAYQAQQQARNPQPGAYPPPLAGLPGDGKKGKKKANGKSPKKGKK